MSNLTRELQVISGSNDISETVYNFRFGNGLNVTSNPETYNRIIANGEIRLRNNDGYWTDDRLEMLDKLTITCRGMTVRCKVTSFDANIGQGYVSLMLGPLIDPNKRIKFDIDMNVKEADLLEAAEIEIANKSSWVGYEAIAGNRQDTTLGAFLNNFAVYADAFVYENALGEYEAFLPATDTRGVTREFSNQRNAMILRTFIARHRRDWRRNVQIWHTLNRDTVAYSTTYPDDEKVRTSKITQISNTGGVRTYRIDLDPLAEMGISQHDFGGFSHFTWENDTYIIDRIDGQNTGVSRNQRVYAGRTPGAGGRPTLFVEVDITTGSNQRNNLEFEDDFTVIGHWFQSADDEGIIPYIPVARGQSVGEDENPLQLPTTNIYMTDAVRPLIESKLNRLRDWTPRMLGFSCPLETQAHLLNYEVGDLVRVDINTPQLDAYGDYYIAYIQRDFNAGRMPLITFELLEKTTLGRGLPDGAEIWREQAQTWRAQIETWRPEGMPEPDPEPIVPAPVARFRYEARNLAYTFDAGISSGDIDSYSWSLGDGARSTSRRFTHTYSSAGTYTVTLTVTGPGGTSTTTQQITARATPVTIPVPNAGFTVSRQGMKVTITNTSLGVGPFTYSYDMGDGTILTTEDPVHTYASTGTYTITQTVTNAGGSDKHSVTIIVSAPSGAPTGLVGWFKANHWGSPSLALFWAHSLRPTAGINSFAAGNQIVELRSITWGDNHYPQLLFNPDDVREFMKAIASKSIYVAYNSNQVQEAALSSFSALSGSTDTFTSQAWGARPSLTSLPFGFIIADSGQSELVSNFINLG